ncbi:MAG: hypothetical protein DMG08_05330, partial [Acidobacteria bacterium]
MLWVAFSIATRWRRSAIRFSKPTPDAIGAQDQHLYFRRAPSGDWREFPLPHHLIADNPRLVRLNGRVSALVERWNSWWPYS